jgi:hypothetical protein
MSFKRFNLKKTKSMKGFNLVLAQNAQLRIELDNLRFEKRRFDDLYSKLESELCGLKREITLLLHESNKAYDER